MCGVNDQPMGERGAGAEGRVPGIISECGGGTFLWRGYILMNEAARVGVLDIKSKGLRPGTLS